MSDIRFPGDPSWQTRVNDALDQVRAPAALPEPAYLDTATDLLLPPKHIKDRLAHFPQETFSLRAESSLVRFMQAILGDGGVGQLQKKLLTSHLQSTLSGSHFYDLDKFYGALFGVRRRTYEQLSINPYSDTATTDQWQEVHLRDSSYRNRIYQFARAINFGATPIGMELVAEALLSVDCDVYETWTMIDQGLENTGVVGDNRKEFVVVPKRAVTLEEVYDVTRIIQRLKPADTIAHVDQGGVEIHSPLTLRGVAADSEYWEVKAEVLPEPIAPPYEVVDTIPVEQPRPPFSAYQGEAWSYNADVSAVLSYALDEDDEWLEFTPVEQMIQQPDRSIITYRAEHALSKHSVIQAGRAVSDGILVSHPIDRGPEYADLRSGI